MTHPKRFRDMGLTEGEADDLAANLRRLCYLRSMDMAPDGWSISEKYLNTVEDRAKRLLPLWRKWAILRLAANPGLVIEASELRPGDLFKYYRSAPYTYEVTQVTSTSAHYKVLGTSELHHSSFAWLTGPDGEGIWLLWRHAV